MEYVEQIYFYKETHMKSLQGIEKGYFRAN